MANEWSLSLSSCCCRCCCCCWCDNASRVANGYLLSTRNEPTRSKRRGVSGCQVFKSRHVRFNMTKEVVSIANATPSRTVTIICSSGWSGAFRQCCCFVSPFSIFLSSDRIHRPPTHLCAEYAGLRQFSHVWASVNSRKAEEIFPWSMRRTISTKRKRCAIAV